MSYNVNTITELTLTTPTENSSYIPELNDAIREIKRALQYTYAVVDIADTDSPYTALTSSSMINGDCTSGAIEVDLPTAASMNGREYTIKKVDSSENALTLDPNGSETIEGLNNIVLYSKGETITIRSDGTNWVIKDKKAFLGLAAKRAGCISYKDTDEIYILPNAVECLDKLCRWPMLTKSVTSLVSGTWYYVYIDYSEVTTTTLTNAEIGYTSTPPWGKIIASGTTTSASSGKLVNSGAGFTTDGTAIGDVVWNTTDNTYAVVTAIDSATTLSISSNIMAGSEGYRTCHSVWHTDKQGLYVYNTDDRVIGAFLADGSGALRFYWEEHGGGYRFASPISELSGGSSSSYIEIDLKSSIPVIGKTTGYFHITTSGNVENNSKYYGYLQGDPVADEVWAGATSDSLTTAPNSHDYVQVAVPASRAINYKIGDGGNTMGVDTIGFNFSI